MRNLAAALASCVLCALLSLVLATAVARAELKPINPFAATEVAPGPPAAFAPRPVAVPFQATGPLGRLFAWVLDKQQGLQRMLATSVKGLKTDNPMAGALTLAGLSFLYGILHAVGPGHGKTIISSYVVANEETARRGVIISFIAAGLQALTAVVLVGLLLFGLNASGLQVNAWSNQLESVSYAMIALVGLYLLTTQLLRLFRSWRGVPQHTRPTSNPPAVMPSIIRTITPITTIPTAMCILMTIRIMATITSITIITRRERHVVISSMRGNSLAPFPGEKSWPSCSRSASGPAPGRYSCLSLRSRKGSFGQESAPPSRWRSAPPSRSRFSRRSRSGRVSWRSSSEVQIAPGPTPSGPAALSAAQRSFFCLARCCLQRLLDPLDHFKPNASVR